MGIFKKKDGPEAKEKQVIVTRRKLTGPLLILVYALSTAGVLFQLYNAGFGVLTEIQMRSFHWLYIGFISFLSYSALSNRKDDRVPFYDILFALVSLACCVYIYLAWPRIANSFGFTNTVDTVFGIVLALLVLEITRRAIGWPLVIVSVVFLLYAFLGGYIKGIFASKNFTLIQVVRTLYASTDGIWGAPMGISASYVILFILFGSFLQASGGGELFTDVAFAMVGKYRGGPAKAAVVSSCMFGMISGAAVANVVATGTFTIPLMKKGGYKPHYAGAVEAVASCGGQFMPPIMGAAAFMVANNCNLPYGVVAISAIIPALLYYFYLFICLDAEAKRQGLSGLSKENLPDAWKAIKARGHMLLPLAVLIYLLVNSYSPGKAVFWSIVLLLVCSTFRKSTRMGPKKLLAAVVDGVNGAMPVAIACACAGIISGVVSLTGLGLRFSSILIHLAGGNQLFMLLLTMVSAIIMGMGLPTTAAYIILSVLTGPALVSLGINQLAAHFFIFFFACISTITPPVALSAYAGAGIAGANPMKTGWTAFRIGLAGYIVPFLVVYKPTLMLLGTPFWPSFVDVTFSIIAIVSMTFTVTGIMGRCRLNVYQRITYGVLSLLIFLPTGNYVDLIAAAVIIALCFLFTLVEKRKGTATPAAA